MGLDEAVTGAVRPSRSSSRAREEDTPTPPHPAGSDYRPPVAGIGFRHSATAKEIVALIHRALVETGHAPDRLRAIATAEDRADEPSIVEAAAAFCLVPIGMVPAEMIAVDCRVPTRSGRIEASRGVGSVAEAAALAAAGEGATLILPRISSHSVTCALALPTHFATQAE